MRLPYIATIIIIASFGIAYSALTHKNVIVEGVQDQNLGATVLYPYQGGTGTGTVPNNGEVLLGNTGGTYTPSATSTLGLLGLDSVLNDLSDVDTAGVSQYGLLQYNGASWEDTLTLGAPDNPLTEGNFTTLNASSTVFDTVYIRGQIKPGPLSLATSTPNTDFQFEYDTDTGLDWLADNTAALVAGGSNSILWGNGTSTITGTLDVADAASFDSYIDFDVIATPSDPPAGTFRVYAMDQSGITVLHAIDGCNTEVEFLRDSVHIVRNNSGGLLSLGEAVYVTGSDGNYPTVDKAQANAENTSDVFGLVMQDISDNSFGCVLSEGDLDGFDTSGFTEGANLYLSTTTAGALVDFEPTDPDIYKRVGETVKSAGSGIIQVTIKGTQHIETGTVKNTFTIGDNTNGTKTLTFNEDTADGSLTWNGASYALDQLTSNGFVKTSGGTGTLSIDTTSYWSALSDITLAENQVFRGNASNNPEATNSLTILSSGLVGIGTTTPDVELVIDSSGAVSDIRLDGSTGGQIIFSKDKSNQMALYTASDSSLRVYDYLGAQDAAIFSQGGDINFDAGTFQLDDSQNNIGIAVAPIAGYGLSIKNNTGIAQMDSGGSFASGWFVDSSGNSIFRQSSHPLIIQQNTNEQARFAMNGAFGISDSSPDFGIEIASSTPKGFLGVSSAAANDGNYFLINSSGNVGIGTTTPSKLLSAAGDAIISGNLTVEGKINAIGGVDPPYVTYTEQTRESIREMSKEFDDKERAATFYNVDTGQMEVYDIKQDTFTPLGGSTSDTTPVSYWPLLGLLGLLGLIRKK